MGPSGFKGLGGVQTWSWRSHTRVRTHSHTSTHTRAPSLRPPGGRASWDPWSVWPGKSFHHWTVRPPSCRSGTYWETRWVWSGSSAGCPGWAASCWGWPQTPEDRASGQERWLSVGPWWTCVEAPLTKIYIFYFTLKTWNASNWMLRLLSRNRFIISLRFSGLLMYFVMMVKLWRSRSSSPSN